MTTPVLPVVLHHPYDLPWVSIDSDVYTNGIVSLILRAMNDGELNPSDQLLLSLLTQFGVTVSDIDAIYRRAHENEDKNHASAD